MPPLPTPPSELPLTVQLLTIIVAPVWEPRLPMPPPELPLTVQPVTVIIALPLKLSLRMPPPELPVTVQSLNISAPPSLYMPPPGSLVALPFFIVSPEMMTVFPASMKTCDFACCCRRLNIIRARVLTGIFLSTFSLPLVNVIFCPLSDASKLIASPSFASTNAWRTSQGRYH